MKDWWTLSIDRGENWKVPIRQAGFRVYEWHIQQGGKWIGSLSLSLVKQAVCDLTQHQATIEASLYDHFMSVDSGIKMAILDP